MSDFTKKCMAIRTLCQTASYGCDMETLESLLFLFKDLFQKHSEVASVGLSDFTAKTRAGLGSE